MSETNSLRRARGAIFALGGPIAGIILWIIVWQLKFIASIVAFAMAWLTVWLYRKGAGGVDRTAAVKVILPYIIVGLVLAFYAVFTADSIYYVQTEMQKGASAVDIMQTADFWRFNNESLFDPQIIRQYVGDIIFTVLLGGLGVYTTLKDIFVETGKKPEETDVAEKPEVK